MVTVIALYFTFRRSFFTLFFLSCFFCALLFACSWTASTDRSTQISVVTWGVLSFLEGSAANGTEEGTLSAPAVEEDGATSEMPLCFAACLQSDMQGGFL
ncbi:hypothetical protein IQ07DRAFT_228538 [Pyrenochaeta sp. DS3sAY3a]|nr:hypothetical protein IQ07DRAFT_228538 [Pyrenochaeta sp. DS3sAY3a]